ncbi:MULTISPECIES: iron ABC transporter permease [unclassified Bosea (in: a-proteobacteria)]|uniref:FecCD family ABC transporter permease n=1 Tax=unclassified Bosea (in: a-proteobacteria) TaxID=2653178 RepID=UPI000F7576B7|nr:MULTISPECIES: iron ABC transporter permease [unclassified Bosea (in: a-proteobacteria)]AZO78035.1 ABC transporter permease [Bosea sp. Tri-49]RXT19204.1 ABC transporter permease [Bosea sp. Tri-39]RXT41476.1 ABC transporter permease [Bosea sp. Tri-54]
MRQVRRRRWLAVGLAALAVLALASLVIGSRSIPLAVMIDALRAYDPRNDLHLVIWELRVPRLITAVLAGAALGLAGAIMQAVTRNALAEPGLLGINAGAAVAVVLAVTLLGLTRPAHYVWLAILGAGLAGAAVFLLGRAHETGTNPVRLVLAGAGLSVVLGAITGIVILNAPPTAFDDFRHWAAGSVESASFEAVAVLAVMVAAGLVVALTIVGGLNVLALGQELGQAVGAAPRTIWLFACLAVMLLAGAATAAAGPIGFVGLIAPHLARAVAGPDHRWILPCSALFAAILLLGADLVGRVVAAPSEVAAGIVVALIGGPFFIMAVRRFRVSRP